MTSDRVVREDRLNNGRLAILDAIYGAVGDSARWIDVTRTVTNVLGGATTLLHRVGKGPQSQRMTMTDLDPAFVQTYEAYYGTHNPWVQWLASQQHRPVLYVNDGEMPSDLLERSEFYADWLRPLGDLRFTFNMSVQIRSCETIELVGTRPRRMGPIHEREQHLLRDILPHLRRAIELSQRLQLADAGRIALDGAVRRLGIGILLVDADRRVVSIDPEAESILAGGGLAIRNGQLRAPVILEGPLADAIDRATGGGWLVRGRSGGLFTIPRPDRLPLSVAIGPVDERDRPLGMAGPLAMVLMTDPERTGTPSEEGLRALFDLTAAEAKLVVALCAGETLASYAEATGTSLNTVKTHLKHVFDKTGETRQADLVRRVTSDLALRFGSDR